MDLTDYQKEVISKTTDFVKSKLENAESGHDWWHVYRVQKLAQLIAVREDVDQFIVALGALLHDIADAKFCDGDEDKGPELAIKFLLSLKVKQEVVTEIENIIRNISFKNTFDTLHYDSPELKVIQDADRLDAMGAIGVARAFNYGGYRNLTIYDPGESPKQYHSKNEYKKSSSSTINHFYEKLLLLKDLMNTETGKQMAVERHAFMEKFLNQFYQEWHGKK